MSTRLAHLELLSLLQDPMSLGCAPGAPVEVVHTHASSVVLCGDRAWKMKKPVKLGFLDFSTLELRRADCEREINLNRRLAPDIYLGLSAVVQRGTCIQMVDSPAQGDDVVEWAVRMRRMPAEGMLDILVPRGEVTVGHIRDFAQRLVKFHARAESAGAAAEHGSVEHLADRLRSNLAQLARGATCVPGKIGLTGGSADDGSALLELEFVDALKQAAERWIRRTAPMLHDRRSKGRVRDGHGDLHARNLCMLGGKITAYDCLEFDDSLRCADVAADVGFLAMDLARLGRPDLADDLVAEYARASGDGDIAGPVRFFSFHYAIVRAMVESIRLGQGETPAAERPQIIRAIRDFAMLAAGYAIEPATLLMMGLPATGKSTLGRALARPMRATVLESDRIRKQLYGIAPTDRGPLEMYSADATARTYAAIAETAVSIQGSVVIDASHHTQSQRASSVAAAVRRRGPWLLVEVHADPKTIAARMQRRAKDPSRTSDATIDVHHALRTGWEAPHEVDPAHHLAIESLDGPRWIDVACQRVLQKLMLSGAAHGVP
jgi:aminoglycoside phosphotransferase family enzyme/predicted kinase